MTHAGLAEGIDEENFVTIAVGQSLPDVALHEFYEQPEGTCAAGPNAFQVADLVKGRTIVILGVPGAFTPTCSAQHLPGFIAEFDRFKAQGVDEIWCVSVNDAFVMGAWGREQRARGKVRMLGDGSGLFTKALGLDLDLTTRGMGIRSKRYAMVAVDGVVKHLAVEAPGEFGVSGAQAVLNAL